MGVYIFQCEQMWSQSILSAVQQGDPNNDKYRRDRLQTKLETNYLFIRKFYITILALAQPIYIYPATEFSSHEKSRSGNSRGAANVQV